MMAKHFRENPYLRIVRNANRWLLTYVNKANARPAIIVLRQFAEGWSWQRRANNIQ
jgi:hypothetical protein